MKYTNVVVYWFSGTGNARAAAGWVAGEAERAGARIRLIHITEGVKEYPETSGPDTLIGFCFPTHGFNAPAAVLHFLARFPKGISDVFFANTRAGLNAGPVFLPGISGVALYLPAAMMMLKGYRTVGLRPVDLPSNWISVHPAFRGSPVRNMYRRWERKITLFCLRLFAGKRVLAGLWDLPLGLALLPISAAYYLVGRFAMAKTFIADHTCTGCGACETGCPVNAISMIKGRPYWSFWCESCMKCMNHCPTNAIQTPHGFVILVWYACFSVIPALVAEGLIPLVLPGNAGAARIGWWIGHTVLGLTCIWLAYHALHWLMRFKAVSGIVTGTSLTSLKFWGRYKPGQDLTKTP